MFEEFGRKSIAFSKNFDFMKRAPNKFQENFKNQKQGN